MRSAAVLTDVARRWLTLGLLAAGPAGVFPFAAAATNYTINPVQIDLTAASTSALLTLTNASEQPISFQVSVFRWTIDAAGESHLEPTQDLLFFPQLLTVEPRSERKLRVGATVPFGSGGAREGTYRLIVEELQPPRTSSGVSVRILTQMSIPVFLVPEKPAPDLRIAGAVLAAGRLSFRLENRGNSRVPPTTTVATGTSASGETVFAHELDGWYVLAGGSRPLETEIPPSACSQIAALTLQVRGQGVDLSEKVHPGPGACPSPAKE